jgi:hypothetical protein
VYFEHTQANAESEDRNYPPCHNSHRRGDRRRPIQIGRSN